MYKYITDLLILCNNCCELDEKYIELKYNIDSIIFEDYFNNNYLEKLIQVPFRLPSLGI